MTQHSEPIPQNSVARSPASALAARVLLAVLLAFGSELLLWTSPQNRGLLDWALLVPGYLALSALLLEIAVRFRLRDVYGLLMLAGVYGMLNGLILNPQTALIDVPRTLLTRAMGAHAAAGLAALALFLGITGGSLRSRRALVMALAAALVIGLGWGTWARWSPVEFGGQPESSPEALLLFGGAGLILVALALRFQRPVTAADLRLGARGWALTLIALGGLLILHLLRGEIDGLSLVVIITLSLFSIMIIWFQMRKKGATLLDSPNAAPFAWVRLAALALVFAAAGAAGYALPRGSPTEDPLALISALFTAYGLIWLPAVSIVLGARAFTRQARAMQL